MITDESPALELRGLTKVFPNGVRAVDNVSLRINRAEIHAVIGENGAGKSTVMKIAYGLERPTTGSVIIEGDSRPANSPLEAISRGVGMVHQNLMLVPSFTIAENVFLGNEPGSAIRVDRRIAEERTEELATEYGLSVDPKRLVSQAAVGMRQRAEILKALSRGAKILILDEPTAVLTPQETDILFAAVRRLQEKGVTVIIISHKLKEILSISDRISVMRAGRLVETVATSESTEESLASAMVGRDVELDVSRKAYTPGKVLLDVRGLRAPASGMRGMLGPMSFTVHAGEILGIAGIEGNGQSELMRVLAGLDTASQGNIIVDTADVTEEDVASRRKAGIANIPEDRLSNGAALDHSIADNLIVDRYRRAPFTRRGVLSLKTIRENALRLIKEYSVRAPNSEVPMSALSGGNMQKVIVARELSSEPKILLAAHPSRGVDIGAMEFMYSRIVAARDEGTAVLLVSADLTELLTLSDRLLVVSDGLIVGRFDDLTDITEETVGRFMLGIEQHSEEIIMAGLGEER